MADSSFPWINTTIAMNPEVVLRPRPWLSLASDDKPGGSLWKEQRPDIPRMQGRDNGLIGINWRRLGQGTRVMTVVVHHGLIDVTDQPRWLAMALFLSSSSVLFSGEMRTLVNIGPSDDDDEWCSASGMSTMFGGKDMARQRPVAPLFFRHPSTYQQAHSGTTLYLREAEHDNLGTQVGARGGGGRRGRVEPWEEPGLQFDLSAMNLFNVGQVCMIRRLGWREETFAFSPQSLGNWPKDYKLVSY